MMPSRSKRIAPVKRSRPRSTRRRTRSISPMDPSKLIPPTPSFALGSAQQNYRTRDSRVQFVVETLSYFPSEDVHQILFGRLLHAGDAAETLDQQTPALLANPRQIIQLAVQHALRTATSMRGDREAMRIVTHHLQQLKRRI